MRYQGSEAYSLGAAERRRERLEQQAAPSFEVVTGGGLDAQVRAGIAPSFLARVGAVLMVAAVLIVLGMARVAVASATVSLLSSNSSLSSQIEEGQTLNDELRIQRSILSSNARISRIATQNYGMVLASDFVTIDVSAASPEASAAQGEAASADAQDSSDGDAAQSGAAGSEQSDMS